MAMYVDGQLIGKNPPSPAQAYAQVAAHSAANALSH